ncbi:carbohydrate kinase [bacterium]|nr:carbohydrate kinase [bacterium]
MQSFDVLLVGHVTRDVLIIGDTETRRIGGAVYYGAAPLKALGKRVAVATKLAQKDYSLLEEFHQQDIPVYALPSRETTQFTITYLTDDGERRKFFIGALADPFAIEDFTDLQAAIIHLCPLLRGEISAEVVRRLAERAKLGLDVQGFVRVRKGDTLHSCAWEEKRNVLPFIHYLKADQWEAEILTGLQDLHQAAVLLASWGPREVLLTHKEGVLLLADGCFYSAPFTTRELTGRTGRGDTCMASYLGRRLTHSAEQACRFAAAVVSAKLKKAGPFQGDLHSEQAIRTTLGDF